MSEQLRVGVSGANGFIGGRLVEWLVLHEMAQVRPIVRSFKGMARLARFDLDVRVADATHPAALQEAVRGCEVLFHCVVGGRETILRSAEAAYQAAAGAGVRRLVYLSSAVVHGHNPPPDTDDDSELLVKQPFDYNISKVMAEHRLRRLRVDGRVEVVTLRPSIVFGPRSTYWTAQLVTDLLAGRAYLVDGGVGICNTVFIDNLVEAMWLAATVPGSANQDFLITDCDRVTWADLYAAVALAVGKDMSEVPSVKSADAARILMAQARTRRLQPLKPLRQAMTYSIARLVPARVRRVVPPRIKRIMIGPETVASAIELDPEIVSLQSCRLQLPAEKARRVLGYRPSISFAEASMRTGAWIRYAFGLDIE